MSEYIDSLADYAKARGESDKAIAAAKKEIESDPNFKDPATAQDRVDAQIKAYRKQLGLEK